MGAGAAVAISVAVAVGVEVVFGIAPAASDVFAWGLDGVGVNAAIAVGRLRAAVTAACACLRSVVKLHNPSHAKVGKAMANLDESAKP